MTRDLTGTKWQSPDEPGSLYPRAAIVEVISKSGAAGNAWRVGVRAGAVLNSVGGMWAWSGVVSDSIFAAWPQVDPSPSDVNDGDLLSGTFYDNPFTDWRCTVRENRHRPNDLQFGKDMFLTTVSGVWKTGVVVTSRKPAPKPLLPWEEHPDAWWQNIAGTAAFRSDSMRHWNDPADWHRVLVVPADTHVAIPRVLITRLRMIPKRTTTESAYRVIEEVVDAADGAS